MECALKLTEVDMTYLINFLIAGGLDESSLPGSISSDEPEITKMVRAEIDGYRPLVKVFGDDYQEVHQNAREHVRGCESCRQDYKAKILAVAGMIDISKRGSEGSEDAGSLDEDLMELDREFLGILYEEE